MRRQKLLHSSGAAYEGDRLAAHSYVAASLIVAPWCECSCQSTIVSRGRRCEVASTERCFWPCQFRIWRGDPCTSNPNQLSLHWSDRRL